MSTIAGRMGSQTTLAPGRRLPRTPSIPSLLKRISLSDWVTAGLLVGMLLSVAWAVQLSKWGQLPSLVPTVLIGAATGWWVARTAIKWYFAHPLAIATGFAVVMWQGSLRADGANVAARANNAWDRMFEWVHVAQSSGISTDPVPFALLMVAAAWLIAYSLSWTTFRFRNPWIPVLLLGIGLLTNLSYRQGFHEQTFYAYLVSAVALFAHLTAVRRMRRWEQRGISYPSSLRWMAVRDGLLLSGLVMAVAALTPLVELRNQSLTQQWNVLRAPIDNLREPASRLLAGVRGNARKPLGMPGEVLAFQGPISLTDDPIMWVTTRYPSMHPARVYQQYTSQGWVAGPRSTVTVPARAPSGLLPGDKARERVDQTVQPLDDTSTVLQVGSVISADRDLTVELLEPARFVIPLGGFSRSLAGYPDDVRQFASNVRLAYQGRPAGSASPGLGEAQQIVAQVERAVATLKPQDLNAIVLVDPETELPSSIVAERRAPFEQVGLQLTEVIQSGASYNLTTYVSLATEEDLRDAGTSYPAWITDRYLQLPPSIPNRVRVLANEIVSNAGAESPYEKALAIAGFLRSQVYSQEIEGPAPQTDGIDYFLFGTRSEPCPTTAPDCNQAAIKGYSQYYGSAATVLFRAVGVPSRMVAGWAQGEYVPAEAAFIVRDRDRHGWTQVFFPEYGWIDIEVTPGKRITPRGESVPTTPESDLNRLIGGSAFDEDLIYQQDIAEAERLAREALAGNRVDLGSSGIEIGDFSVPVQAYYALIAIGIAVFLAYLFWRAIHIGLDPASAAYTKMVRAGWLMGVRRQPSQTASEYAGSLGLVLPSSAEAAGDIAHAYERLAYARRKLAKDELARVNSAWRKISRGILAYRLAHPLRGTPRPPSRA